MKLFTLFIGLPRDAHTQRHVDYVCNRAAMWFGGFTAVLAEGGWRNPDTGKVEREQSLRLEIATLSLSEVELFARGIATELDQKEVLVAVTSTQVETVVVAPQLAEA